MGNIHFIKSRGHVQEIFKYNRSENFFCDNITIVSIF